MKFNPLDIYLLGMSGAAGDPNGWSQTGFQEKPVLDFSNKNVQVSNGAIKNDSDTYKKFGRKSQNCVFEFIFMSFSNRKLQLTT